MLLLGSAIKAKIIGRNTLEISSNWTWTTIENLLRQNLQNGDEVLGRLKVLNGNRNELRLDLSKAELVIFFALDGDKSQFFYFLTGCSISESPQFSLSSRNINTFSP